MSEDDVHRCRVCGYWYDDPPWGQDGDFPSFDMCILCGVEFGYKDRSVEAVRRFRQSWLDRGGAWTFPEARPAAWSLDQQLTAIPERWR